jgi:hypothetical protein
MPSEPVKTDWDKYGFPKRGHLPRKLVFFDCETRPARRVGPRMVEHETFLIVASKWVKRRGKYRRCGYYKFSSAREFTEWLSREAPLVAFAHNLSYDMRAGVDLELLREKGWKLKTAVLDTRKFFVTFQKGKRTLKFIDSLNYLPLSIWEIGKIFGLEKLEMPSWDDLIEKWVEYCKRDVEILETFVTWLIQEMWRMGVGLKPTAASYAFALYNLRYKPRYVKFVPSCDEKVVRLEREAYFGGRVELFRVGKVENVCEIDVNSMYPYVMKTIRVPTKPLYYEKEPSVEKLRRLVSEGEAVIARVAVNVPESLDPPPAPWRDPRTGKVMFPAGRFETVLCTPELKLVLPYVEKVREMVVYCSAHAFKEYVEDLYRKRVEARERGEKPLETLYKLLLNSLYGKFAEKRIVKGEVEVAPPGSRPGIHVIGKGMVVYVKGPFRIKGKVHEEVRDRFTAVSAFITSAARAHLWKAMRLIGKENLVYCDTDSIHFVYTPELEKKLEPILSDSELGKFKVEAVAQEGEYILPKLYRLGGKVRAKGMPHSPNGEVPLKAVEERVLGFRESIRRLGKLALVWETRVKEVRSRYDKRVVHPDGTTSPVKLDILDTFITPVPTLPTDGGGNGHPGSDKGPPGAEEDSQGQSWKEDGGADERGA